MDTQKIWFESPRFILSDINLIPNESQTFDEKLNALTRLIIVISVILLLFKCKNWYLFLIFGLIIVIGIHTTKTKSDTIDFFNENMEDFSFYSTEDVLLVNQKMVENEVTYISEKMTETEEKSQSEEINRTEEKSQNKIVEFEENQKNIESEEKSLEDTMSKSQVNIVKKSENVNHKPVEIVNGERVVKHDFDQKPKVTQFRSKGKNVKSGRKVLQIQKEEPAYRFNMRGNRKSGNRNVQSPKRVEVDPKRNDGLTMGMKGSVVDNSDEIRVIEEQRKNFMNLLN